MSTVLFLIPLALFLGALGLGAFLWSLNSGQYDDLEGASLRILRDDDDDELEPKNIAKAQEKKEKQKENPNV